MNSIEASRALKEARLLAKEAQGGEGCDIKVAVLGSLSVQHFAMLLRYYLAEGGVRAALYEGEFNGIAADALDAASPLYAFAPNAVILLPDWRDIKEWPRLLHAEDVAPLAESFIAGYKQVWAALAARLPGVAIFQGNIAVPAEAPLGNLEANFSFSRRSYIRKINAALLDAKPSNVNLVDVDHLSSIIGKSAWFDAPQFFLSKMPCALDFLPDLARLFAKEVLALKGKSKKCLVLDLDNTLWGGVVAEEGPCGIALDPNDAVGEAYLAFQEYLLLLKERGVILAVCSKNDVEAAKEPFTANKYMRLRLDDIACFVANWNDKASNIKSIARELNIGVESMVFFDDSPAEREVVRRFLPEVDVIDVPEDPALYVAALDAALCFEWLELTGEDMRRNQSYVAEGRRREMAVSYSDYSEYLKALNMRARIGFVAEGQRARFTQLVNKSNQFNLRTRRYTEQAIAELMAASDAKCIAAELSDKFSDYGLVSCVILRKTGDVCFIDTWVMSCRVLKRGLELAVFERILGAAREWGCSCLAGEFIPTAKNALVKGLYAELGFEAVAAVGTVRKTEESAALYRFDAAKSFNQTHHIKIEED